MAAHIRVLNYHFWVIPLDLDSRLGFPRTWNSRVLMYLIVVSNPELNIGFSLDSTTHRLCWCLRFLLPHISYRSVVLVGSSRLFSRATTFPIVFYTIPCTILISLSGSVPQNWPAFLLIDLSSRPSCLVTQYCPRFSFHSSPSCCSFHHKRVDTCSIYRLYLGRFKQSIHCLSMQRHHTSVLRQWKFLMRIVLMNK
jgi:hypothetical protein